MRMFIRSALLVEDGNLLKVKDFIYIIPVSGDKYVHSAHTQRGGVGWELAPVLKPANSESGDIPSHGPRPLLR